MAGFIGRTNFLDAEVRGDDVVFDHFTVPRRRFSPTSVLQGRVTFSLRPQSVHLHRLQPDLKPPTVAAGACVFAGSVVQRAYLGEYWDYAVRPVGGELRLRVTARPHEVFEVDERVWLELDPRQLARIV